jgi:hypothetical protein
MLWDLLTLVSDFRYPRVCGFRKPLNQFTNFFQNVFRIFYFLFFRVNKSPSMLWSIDRGLRPRHAYVKSCRLYYTSGPVDPPRRRGDDVHGLGPYLHNFTIMIIAAAALSRYRERALYYINIQLTQGNHTWP